MLNYRNSNPNPNHITLRYVLLVAQEILAKVFGFASLAVSCCYLFQLPDFVLPSKVLGWLNNCSVHPFSCLAIRFLETMGILLLLLGTSINWLHIWLLFSYQKHQLAFWYARRPLNRSAFNAFHSLPIVVVIFISPRCWPYLVMLFLLVML